MSYTCVVGLCVYICVSTYVSIAMACTRTVCVCVFVREYVCEHCHVIHSHCWYMFVYVYEYMCFFFVCVFVSIAMPYTRVVGVMCICE